jgi:hypothetical protein
VGAEAASSGAWSRGAAPSPNQEFTVHASMYGKVCLRHGRSCGCVCASGKPCSHNLLNTRCPRAEKDLLLLPSRIENVSTKLKGWSSRSPRIIRLLREDQDVSHAGPHRMAFLHTPRKRLPGLDAPISTILNDSATSTVQTRAVEKFNYEIPESSKLHVDEKATFKDVLSELQSILNDVRVRRSPLHDKVQRVLRRLDNLAVVGDVMCQYDSHHASLAWGGFRLLLRLGLEQFEMLDRIIDSFDQIFLLIGRVQLYDTMFGTNRLQLGIETLYKHIIDFTQRAIRYLKKGRLGRLRASVCSPYQAEFHTKTNKNHSRNGFCR